MPQQDDVAEPDRTDPRAGSREAPRFVVPVPVGSVAPRGPQSTSVAAGARRVGGAPRPPRPDVVALAVILLRVSAAASVVALVVLAIGTATAAGAAARAGLDAGAVGTGAIVLLVLATIVVVVQLALTELVARGSDVARAWLAVVAGLAVLLAILGDGGTAIGTTLLVVGAAALFVPTSSTWFGQIRRTRA